MYIVEWYDCEGNRHERAFNSQEAAKAESAALEKEFDHVAIIWEANLT